METTSPVTTITIRKATRDDLDALAEFLKTFVAEGHVLPRTFQELEDLVDTLFIAEMDGELVGTAALEIYSKKLAELRSLAVSPKAQGNGVGKKLVAACVELGEERGIFEIMAISHEEAFFKACGFDFTLPNLRKAFFIQTRDDL
ncbi:MAG: GNAT family N-acetyltransferase [Anaerolineae bacterium]|nr:GNAT family N-acetyltransferase [Anaerolineae bacterium]MDQ7033784.1 GNAT family N-acetyltransferase [Anaerolineae bacterium]